MNAIHSSFGFDWEALTSTSHSSSKLIQSSKSVHVVKKSEVTHIKIKFRTSSFFEAKTMIQYGNLIIPRVKFEDSRWLFIIIIYRLIYFPKKVIVHTKYEIILSWYEIVLLCTTCNAHATELSKAWVRGTV